jgi:hypothetical protein
MSYQIIPFIYACRRKCSRPLQLRVEEFYLFTLFVCFFLLCSLSLVSLVCCFLPSVITPQPTPSPYTYDDDWTFCACLALVHVGISSFCLRVD